MTVLAIADGLNELALAVFVVVLAITLLITWWASKRTHSATEFWAANRGISSLQNGFAIAGDYLGVDVPRLRGPDLPVRRRRLGRSRRCGRARRSCP